ncbi:MAG: hypothetical protein EXS00_01760 [Phycisphaerales bacterium]|nr:hypothetical protein [Phycisphaerales bacterium]
MVAIRPIKLISVLTLLVAGCIPQQKYDDLVTAYRSQEQQLLGTQGELETIKANESRLRNQLAQAAADLEGIRGMRDGQGADVDKLLADYESLLRQVANLDVGVLPAAVNEALKSLASQYPDMLQFDERRGMLRFAADFTFDLGSANLKSGTSEVLGRLAQIINSPDVVAYEVVVVGHTDNVPIRKSSTAALHPTNVYLSAHRAITVRDALVHDGVAANRFEVAGYGEFRPIVANGARGAAENRRVEIFLSPMLIPLADMRPSSDGGAPRSAPMVAPASAVDDEPTK